MTCELTMSAEVKYHFNLLHRVRQDKLFVDIYIKVLEYHINPITGTKSMTFKWIPAHKCVLAASGNFFRRKLIRQLEDKPKIRHLEQDKPTIEFDLSKEFWTSKDLTAVIDYMYSGNITLTLDNLLNITYLAKLFGIFSLENLCDKYVGVCLSEKTFLRLYIALLSNDKVLSISDKMRVHRNRLGEFIQSIFFSQLLNNEQLKKLSSQEMLLLIRNVVFYGIQCSHVLNVLKLALNWPLTHKDTESIRVSEQLIHLALTIRFSDLSNFQRIEVEHLMSTTADNTRVYFEKCGAKLATRFQSYIQKALEFVYGEIDESEFSKEPDISENSDRSSDTESDNSDGKIFPKNETSPHSATVTTAATDTSHSEDTTNYEAQPNNTNNKVKIKHETIDNPNSETEQNIGEREMACTIDKAESLPYDGCSDTPDPGSEVPIKVEIDVDDDSYSQECQPYLDSQSGMMVNTTYNTPSSSGDYVSSDLMSGIAKQLSINQMVMQANMQFLRKTNECIATTIRQKRKIPIQSSCHTSKGRKISKIARPISVDIDEISDTRKNTSRTDETQHVQSKENIVCNKSKLGNHTDTNDNQTDKDTNIQPHFVDDLIDHHQHVDDSTTCVSVNTEINSNDTIKEPQTHLETDMSYSYSNRFMVSDSKEDESTRETMAEATEDTDTLLTQGDSCDTDNDGGGEATFYEYVLDQISHHIEDRS